jgi:spore coat polysaccharide biosynthesis protein SpsF
MLRESTCDYASNTHTRSYPRGLDVEALYLETLVRIASRATSAAAREHVTAFVLEQPALFEVRQLVATTDDSDLRWTVDTAEDLELVRTLYTQLDLGRTLAPYRTVVDAIRAQPTLAAINAHVVQKSWHTAQREDDRVA